MSALGELKLEEGTFFDFVTHHPSTAAVTDADSGPTAEVFEDATDTTVVALTVTKRTSKTGNYRCPVTAAAADGFEVGKTYNVVASATVNSIAGKGIIGRFKVRARGKDDLAFPATSGRSMVVDAAGLVDANMVKAGPTGSGTAQTARDIGASVLLSPGTGTGQLSITSGVVGADMVQVSGDSAVADLIEALFDGTAGPVAAQGISDKGIAQSVSGDEVVIRAAAAFGDDTLRGQTLAMLGSDQGYWQSRVIASNVGATDTVTLDEAYEVEPTGTLSYFIFMTAPGSAAGGLDAAGVRAAVGLASANLDTQLGDLPTNAELATSQASADDATLAAIAALNNLNAAGVRAAVGLASANLDTQLADLPTNAELATSQAGADDATLAAIAALNNLSAAQVNAEVDTALADIHLDHLLAATYDPASKPGAADALLNELVESDGGVARFTANALEEAPSGTGASAASIVAAMFTEDTGETEGDAVPGSVVYEIVQNAGGGGGLDAAGVRAAVGLASANLDTQLADLPTNAELATSQAAADDATIAAIAALNNLSIANVRTAVGLASANLDTQLAALPTAVENASQVRTELGTELGRLDAAISTRSTVTTAQVNAEADTALADVGLTSVVTGRVDAAISTRATPAQVATELGTYDAPTKAELDAAVASLNDVSAADVLSQVQSALTATVADSVPADGTRPSIAQGIYMITQFMLERQVSGTTLLVKKPDGTTTLLTLTLGDATSPTSITRAS